MSSESTKFLAQLPPDWQTRVNMIIHTIPGFWEQKLYQHFTNQGPIHSERVLQKLEQLALNLPEERRLNKDEIFIISGAVWLYEIGMQSPNLKPILDFDYQPGDSLSFPQLQDIRTKKHLLTEQLILDSVRGKYQGPPLGLIPPEDGYVRCIRLVCRWCSNEPLDNVQPEILPVNGVPVRVKLLVALLRLADQLYIDGSRINLDLLERSNLPIERYARWWVHNYVQILPIKNGQIHFYYFLPASQKEYLGHIRALIEPNFEHKNNPVIKYLMTEHQLYLIPDETPTVQFDAGSFVRPMSSNLIGYLRQETKSPIETFIGVPGPPYSQLSSYESEKGCLLVLDYENLIVQLGQEGYFFTPKKISQLAIELLKEASNETTGPVRALAIGHWDRSELREAAQILENRVYDLITLERQENASTKIREELGRWLEGSDASVQVILVAPHEYIATIILREFDDKRQSMNTWISKLPAAEIFQFVVGKYRFLQDILPLQDLRNDNALIKAPDETQISTSLIFEQSGDSIQSKAVPTIASTKPEPGIPPFPETYNNCTFSISCSPGYPPYVRANGIVNLSSVAKNPLDIDINRCVRRTNNAFRNDWRFNAKDIGGQLYDQIFGQKVEIFRHYYYILGKVGSDETMRLRFETDRYSLRIPFEFLHDEKDYLLLKHPITRLIVDNPSNTKTLSPDFFNELYRKDEPLKVLLITSNTAPAIPKVDQEIEALSSLLPGMFRDKQIRVEVTTLRTEQATYKVVKDELKDCPYHIVHYAGHGGYDQESPEQSYLLFREKPNRQSEDIKELSVSELQMLLKSSKTLRFFYLSCCVSAATGDSAKLLDDDFLGIADGVIQAGIPAVLGFRWPAPDDGAKTLALAFYKSLARQGQIDTALLEARQEVAGLNRDDRTWISPILIMQE